MIINAFLDFILYAVVSIFGLFPTVHIVDIPVIGGFISTVLITMVSLFNSFLLLFPFGVVVWHAFLWVLVFEGSLLGLKFILGSRVPANM